MKIVQVVHDFLPYNYGGVQIYTYNLAKKLSENNEVYIFFRKGDRNLPEYQVETEVYEGLPLTSINNNFSIKPNFLIEYEDSEIDKAFRKFLEKTKPDIVHFQYIGCGISAGTVAVAKEHNIPTLLTIQDYWFMCPRGQMMNYKWELCSEVIEEKCARCVFGLHEPISALEKHQEDLTTAPGPKENIAFCAAGWGDLRIVLKEANNAGYGVIGLRKKKDLIKRILSLGYSLIIQSKKDSRKLIGALNKAYLMIRGNKAKIKQIEKRNKYLLKILKEIDLLISPSNFLREKYINFGVPPERIIFSDYGMNTNIVKKSQRSPSDKLIFGFMGTFMPTKGVHVLIDAFVNVPEDKAELKIYGYAPNEYHLKYLDLIKRKLKGNNNIKMMGKYDIKDITKILSEIDVLVVPSVWWENSPLTIHEAFMAGVPVITSDIGGMAELVKHKANGLLFKVGDSEDLYRKIMVLIENPSLIRELSANVPSIKSVEENAEELEKIYKDLIANSEIR